MCEFYSTPVYYSNRRAAIAISEMDWRTKKDVDSIIIVKQSHQLLPGQHLSVYRQQFAQHLL